MCYNAYTLFRGRISATMRSRCSCGVIGFHWQAPRSRIARLLIRHAELVWRGEGREGSEVCQKSPGRRTSQQRRYPSQPRSPSSRSWAPAALALLWVVPFDVGMSGIGDKCRRNYRTFCWPQKCGVVVRQLFAQFSGISEWNCRLALEK